MAPVSRVGRLAASCPSLAEASDVQAPKLKAQNGKASWYGPGFYGGRTANGEKFRDDGTLTAAHRTLPFDTCVLVTDLTNGKSVVVRINDRGPFHPGREIDLSKAAREQLGTGGIFRVSIAVLPKFAPNNKPNMPASNFPRAPVAAAEPTTVATAAPSVASPTASPPVQVVLTALNETGSQSADGPPSSDSAPVSASPAASSSEPSSSLAPRNTTAR